MKRILFLTLSVFFMLILPTILLFLSVQELSSKGLSNKDISMLVFMVGILICASYFVLHILLISNFNHIFPIMGLLTINFKRVYYSELGYFYIKIKNDEVEIYEQNILYIRNIFDVTYNGDIDKLKSDIEKRLNNYYRDRMEKNKKKEAIKNWTGNIDIKSERDDKLNKLLK
jgi:hypothetical protein